jgi:hypothetical protein
MLERGVDGNPVSTMDSRIVQWIENKHQVLSGELTERARRRWAAVEAASLERGGISAVSAATGLGRRHRPQAPRLLITADSGGSNSSRNRLWKVELQRLSDATGLEVEVCLFPPGTSKWNKIEHRLFCHVTRKLRVTIIFPPASPPDRCLPSPPASPCECRGLSPAVGLR